MPLATIEVALPASWSRSALLANTAATDETDAKTWFGGVVVVDRSVSVPVDQARVGRSRFQIFISYAVGLKRIRGLRGAGQLQARLGGIAAAQGDLPTALDHFQTGARQHLADGGSDPFWTVVRAASPAARTSANRRRLDAALSQWRKDPSMQEGLHEFRPQLIAVTPADWLAKEKMTLTSPNEQANVIAGSEPLGPEIDSRKYADAQGHLLRKDLADYVELGLEETELLGSRRGFIRHFEWKPQDSPRVSQLQLYYAENGRGYTATATTDARDFGAVEVELRQLLGGLRIAP